jgi:hypothetical protein
MSATPQVMAREGASEVREMIRISRYDTTNQLIA